MPVTLRTVTLRTVTLRAMTWRDMTLRAMTWRDIPAVHAIEGRVFLTNSWRVETFWSELAGVPSRRWYAVAVTQDCVVGYGGVSFADAVEADIQTVVVDHDYRRGGIGARLVACLLVRAVEHGAAVCHLEVRVDNHAAVNLYERLGFATIERRVNYDPNGVDTLVMSCLLAESHCADESSPE